MSTALSALRRQLEELVPSSSIESRGVGTGITALNELLPMRGLPRGKLTEIRGERSSGIATVLRHIVTSVSQDRLVAYIDARRTLMAGDFVGSRESGIGNRKSGKGETGKGKRSSAGSYPVPGSRFPIPEHLWIIRPPIPSDGHWCADVLLRSGAFALVVLDGVPPVSRSTAARLIRLARETGTALVVAGEEGRGSGVVGAAVRVRVGNRELGIGNRDGNRKSGKGEMGKGKRSSIGPRPIPDSRFPIPVSSHFPFPASRHLVITIEKGGIRRGVEVRYEIGLEDRLCAHPAVGDRRGAGRGSGIGNRESGIGQPGKGKGKGETGNHRIPDSRFPIPESRPHWDQLPIALVSDVGRVRLASRAAARGGIRSGMMVTAARALCADLEVRPWDDVAIAGAVDEGTAALLAVASHVSPVPGAAGTWWVGASGYEALGGERRLAESLLTVARRWHPGARVAVAGSCVAAFAATWDLRREWGIGNRESNGRDARRATRDAGSQSRFPIPDSRFPPLIIAASLDADYLSNAPLALIPMDEEIREALIALGMRTAGALARLEAGEVERRWGGSGLAAWRLANGDDPRRPVLADPERPRTVSAELAVPVDTMEPALFLVRSALERLVPSLAADGRSAAAIAVTLTLDTARTALPTGARAHTVTREVRLPRPVARVKPLFDHCQGLLERWPLEAPLCGVAVAIVATAPAFGDQGDLLDATWRDPGAAEAALARIRAALGAGTVVRAEKRDGHVPERAAVWGDVKEREMGNGKRETSGIGNRESGIGQPRCATRDARRGVAVPIPDSRLPIPDENPVSHSVSLPASLRLLESPESVEVECADGTPCAVWWQGERLTIARAFGPERLSGDWWTADPYARDYWRCGGVAGELLVYADTRDGRWYVQGWYD